MNRGQTAAVLTAFILSWSAPAGADYNDDATKCEGTAAQGITPDVVIAACTAVLQSGDAGRDGRAIAYYNRANAHYDKKELDQAIRDYSEAIKLKPDFTSALKNRGLTKKQMGDNAGGDADLMAAKATTPQHAN
jgi:tetratricopeptide (TPR) repeat protein